LYSNHQIKKLNLFCLLWFAFGHIYAQQNSFLNREWNLSLEQRVHKISDSIPFQSSVKPYILPIQKTTKDTSCNYFVRKLSRESFILVNDTTDKFYLTIDPLFNFEKGKDLPDTSKENLYKNTRGALVRGAIGNKFYFESWFYENQATYAQYVDNYIQSTERLFPGTAIVPGQGRAKPFRTNGYDFAMASGLVSYSPNKYFNFQAGHGKHFIGDGYRSLLLSDNSHNYPYARITSTYKKIQYTNLYTVFTNLTNGGTITPPNIERLFQKKIGSYQLLSINAFKRFQLGLFQGMIWQPADSTNSQNVNFNTFNPLIFTNSMVYGLRSRNNVVLGATFKLKITNSISLFGQYVIDDIKRKTDGNKIHNKQGYQIGIKYFDMFKVKNLHFQAEYNTVNPYTYSASNYQYSFTHFNQALAHPLGANFKEAVVFLNYKVKNFFVQYKLNYFIKGNDSTQFNSGGNIFKSDNTFSPQQDLNNIAITQGSRTTTLYNDLQIGYLINPATNFNIAVGITDRQTTPNSADRRYQLVYITLRTSLANFYYDF
jgi:hypothetical protein